MKKFFLKKEDATSLKNVVNAFNNENIKQSALDLLENNEYGGKADWLKVVVEWSKGKTVEQTSLA